MLLVLLIYHFGVGLKLFFPIEYGDLRIREGSDSGLLEFDIGYYEWHPICKDGFDDDAGDVACRQLGYAWLSDVYVYSR